MTPYYDHAGIQLFLGDCREVMRELAAESVDAIVTDPPYGLEFMGKDWDKLGATAAKFDEAQLGGRTDYHGKGNAPFGGGGNRIRYGSSAESMQSWHESWAAEALRVLKPGGCLLSFGGTRTSHRLVCAIEDAGFEIRDTIGWVYSTGFPKSLDVSKAIDKAAGAERRVVGRRVRLGDKTDYGTHGTSVFAGNETGTLTAPATEAARQWQGWGTALKPAHEPIVLARKPLVGTVAENVLRYGTGGLHIDSARIPADRSSDQGFSSEADARTCPLHGLRGLRQTDAPLEISSKSGEMADDVWAEVPRSTDEWQRQPAMEGRDVAGLEIGLQVGDGCSTTTSGSSFHADADTARLFGTSSHNGPTSRSTVGQAGDGSPRQRRQGRQSPREPTSNKLDAAHAGTQKGTSSDCQPRSGECDAPRCTCRPITSLGRWPANLIHDGSEEVLALFPQTTSARQSWRGEPPHYNGRRMADLAPRGHDDNGGSAARFFYQAKERASERWKYLTCDCETVKLSAWVNEESNRPALMECTLPPRDTCEETSADDSRCNMFTSGPLPTDLSRQNLASTIGTGTSKTTESKTSRSSVSPSTSGCTTGASDDAGAGTNPVVSAVECSKSLRTTSISRRKDGHCTGVVVDATSPLWSETSVCGVCGSKVRSTSHPTQKPVALMRYLCRLVTPPGGLVLDPFMGSGSTGKACVLEGFSFLGIEQDAAYCAIAEKRIVAARRLAQEVLLLEAP